MNICEKIEIEVIKNVISNMNIPYENKCEMIYFIDCYSRVKDIFDIVNYFCQYNQYGYYLH